MSSCTTTVIMANMSTNSCPSLDVDGVGSISGIVSLELTEIFTFVNYAIICCTICLAGIIGNVINIIIFVKQEPHQTVNISLLAISISDLLAEATLLWLAICYVPAFQDANLPFLPTEVQYITGDWPHACFARITGWITALVMCERWLCVCYPLKVKNIFNARRVRRCIIFIFIFLISTILPIYYTNRLDWKFYPKRNRTLVGLVFLNERGIVENVSNFLITLIALPLSFIVVLGCTVGIAVKLFQQSKWRQSSSSVDSATNLKTKDKKVVKMMVIISSIYIACFFPTFVLVVGMIIEPEYVVTGRYENLYITTLSFAYVLEAINSSVNIIVYYFMSSRYRMVFLSIFCGRRIKRNKSSTTQPDAQSQAVI